jgi:HlyD family secretion protein
MIRRPLASALAAALFVAGCNGSDEHTHQGWIEADLIFVGADEAGRIDTLAVRQGDSVKAGSPVFALDDELQRADVSAAEAAVAEARARLARAEAQQQRPAEIAVLEAQQARAEAALALSTAELERQKQLLEKGFTSKAQFDLASANHKRDSAMLDEIRRQITVARLAAREEDIAAARQSLAAAKARSKAAETRLARRRVSSPASGSVEQVYYRVGEMVPAGRAVIALLPPGNVKVRFYVNEALLPSIRLGDVVSVRCDGCAGDLSANIIFIARSAEFTPPVIYSREERSKLVFLIEARPEHPERLRIGQPVSVALIRPERSP